MIDFDKYLKQSRGVAPPRPSPSPGRIDFSKYLGPRGGEERPRIFAGGPVEDIFDVLLASQYAAAGLATGKGIRRGIEERTSYGELLTPEFRQTIPGKVSEFAMNVLGDPITYIPVGGLAVRGLRAVPGGVRAIEAAKVPVRAVAERAGLAFPRTVRAAGAVAGLVEPQVEPLREALRGVRSGQEFARLEAVKFSREFQQDALQLAGGNRQGAGQYRALATEYFRIPGRVIVEGLETEAEALRGAAKVARGQYLSAQRRAIEEVARETAGAVRRTAADALEGLRVATKQALRTATDFSLEKQNAIMLRASQVAASVAARGGTARQAELEVVQSIAKAARDLGRGDLAQELTRAFREAAAPITRGRTLAMAREVAATARAQVRGLRAVTEEASRATLDPAAFGRIKAAAEQSREAWLQTLPADAQAFVRRWGERVTKQHEGDLRRLVQLGILTPERAELWRGVYLRNSYLRHVDPTQYADLLAKTEPVEAAKIMAGTERRVGRGVTEGGIPGAVQIRPRKPLTEAQQEALGIFRNLDEQYAVQRSLTAELIGRAELNEQAARLYAIPQDQVQRLAQGVPRFERLFRPMPDDARWGKLANQWVPKEIHDILTATAWKPEGLVGTWVKLIAAWKIGKVAMPGTIRRNLTTNLSLMQTRLGARGLGGALAEMPEAFKDVRGISPLYMRAVKAHPGFGTTQLDAEVLDLLKAAGDPQNVRGMSDAIVGAVQAVGRPFTTAYSLSESVSKMALFRWGVKNGLSDRAASIQAMLTLYDYGEVPPAILALRRYGLWPFVTFPYKVVTHTIPAVLEHPGRLAQQVKALRAVTVPTTEEERRAMPPQLRSGGYVKVPVPDWKGRPLFYDITYEAFFGDLGEPGTPLGQAVSWLRGDVGAGQAVPTFLTPIGQAAAEIAANKSFFTGAPVRRLEEPALPAQLRHVARAALPGPVFAGAEAALTPALRRLGMKPTSVLARAVHGVPTARGVEPPSIPAAVAQTFGGFRTVPLDIEREKQANVIALRARRGELDRRINAIIRDQALRGEEKRRAIARLQEAKRQLTQRFQQTGAP